MIHIKLDQLLVAQVFHGVKTGYLSLSELDFCVELEQEAILTP
jgi:hypothetical protein